MDGRGRGGQALHDPRPGPHRAGRGALGSSGAVRSLDLADPLSIAGGVTGAQLMMVPAPGQGRPYRVRSVSRHFSLANDSLKWRFVTALATLSRSRR